MSVRLICTCIIFLLVGVMESQVAVVPIKIDADKPFGELPLIYSGASNYFIVDQMQRGDSLILQGGTSVLLTSRDSLVYSLSTPNLFTEMPCHGELLHFIIMRDKKPMKEFVLCTALLPPVCMHYYLDDQEINNGFDADSVYHAKTCMVRAKLVYPAYAKSNFRFRGVFDVVFTSKGERLFSTTGWYDAGDRTRLIEIPDTGDIMEISIDEQRLKFIAFGPTFGNGEIQIIRLSEDTPRVVRVRFG
jgi:hypothetical protein